MKNYEIHVSASYITDGGSEEWNCFKEYVTANTAAEAMKKLKAELRLDGYRNIEMDAVAC